MQVQGNCPAAAPAGFPLAPLSCRLTCLRGCVLLLHRPAAWHSGLLRRAAFASLGVCLMKFVNNACMQSNPKIHTHTVTSSSHLRSK